MVNGEREPRGGEEREPPASKSQLGWEGIRGVRSRKGVPFGKRLVGTSVEAIVGWFNMNLKGKRRRKKTTYLDHAHKANSTVRESQMQRGREMSGMKQNIKHAAEGVFPQVSTGKNSIQITGRVHWSEAKKYI